MESGRGVVEDEIAALKKRVAACEVAHNELNVDLMDFLRKFIAIVDARREELDPQNGGMPCDSEPLP